METIDIHAHWYPQEWIRLFEKDGPKEGASLERKEGKYHLKVKHITNAFDERFVVVDERVGEMNKRGVDVHALSLTTPMVYWASPALGLALSQAFNDAASAAHLRHPDRLVGLAMVPMHSPSHALKELERAAKLPGMKGLYLSTNVNNEELDEKKFWDVYAKCEELGWTIFLHPVDTIGQDRTKKYYLKNLCGNPYDTGVAAAHLIFGGVLDKFEKLSFNLPHAGGTFPWLIGRWDHGAGVRPELKHMKNKPRVPAALHLRHHRPRRPHQQRPGQAGRRGSGHARQRLLLRHGPRRSRRHRGADGSFPCRQRPDQGGKRVKASAALSSS